MKRMPLKIVLLFALASIPAVGIGNSKVDIGKREYEANCAVCHGRQGKGDGPYASLLQPRPPNLTVLAKNNGGVFPMTRVYEVIDGQRGFMAHGPRDMPIWGWEYRAELMERYGEYPFDPEFYVRARILALAEYLYRLQQK